MMQWYIDAHKPTKKHVPPHPTDIYTQASKQASKQANKETGTYRCIVYFDAGMVVS